jgi:hypothetical protein
MTILLYGFYWFMGIVMAMGAACTVGMAIAAIIALVKAAIRPRNILLMGGYLLAGVIIGGLTWGGFYVAGWIGEHTGYVGQVALLVGAIFPGLFFLAIPQKFAMVAHKQTSGIIDQPPQDTLQAIAYGDGCDTQGPLPSKGGQNCSSTSSKAKTMLCDVCNTSMESDLGDRIQPALFIYLLDNGFQPHESNIEMLTKFGVQRSVAEEMLKTQYRQSKSDWLLCDSCSARAREILKNTGLASV